MTFDSPQVESKLRSEEERMSAFTEAKISYLKGQRLGRLPRSAPTTNLTWRRLVFITTQKRTIAQVRVCFRMMRGSLLQEARAK